ncbi:hypothetical protein CAPTEDRAFT_36920, partial [Capitella teleta]
MSNSLYQMRTEEEFVDVVLLFGERKFPCHKVVLASTCEYFHRMFLAGMQESSSAEIAINEIESDIGELIIGYLYSGTLDTTEENAQRLLAASEMLLLGDLKEKLEEFLCDHIQAANCVSLLSLSRLYKLQELIKDAQNYLNSHCQEILNEGDLVELQEDDLVGIL